MPTIPIGLPAINTLIQVGDGASPEVFSTIANLGDEDWALGSKMVDVTSHSSDVPWVQQLPTLLDGKTITTTLYFIPSSGGPSGGVIGHNNAAGLLKFFTNRGALKAGGVALTAPGTPMNFKLVFPDGVPTTYSFTAFIQDFKIQAKEADVERATVTFLVTGEPTFA